VSKRIGAGEGLLVDGQPALAPNRVFDHPGPVVFEHACKFGCEGIVSKRHGSRYVGGRSSNWLTVKNQVRWRCAPGTEAEEQ
jgi:ATP-dependent DNA ligase